MSYDFSLVMDEKEKVCPYCGNSVEELVEMYRKVANEEDINYTYNVSPMFRLALGKDEGVKYLHKRKGSEVRMLLADGITNMKLEPDKYKALNPENGWGNYDGALEVLNKLHSWSVNYPEAMIYIS